MALMEVHIFSEVLEMEMKVHVILPQEKGGVAGNQKLRVLWLLHGGSGDDTAWLRMSNIERYALTYGIAVVLPGGMNSCFTDMVHGGRFFTYITDELPFLLRHMFPCLSDERKDNFISGFSNGGFGCLRVGLAKPNLYSAIGAFSAGDKSDVKFANDGSKRAYDRIIVFGEGSLKNTENDLKYLGREALKKGYALPRVYHACGSLDPWLDLNERMQDFFMSLKGNPYDYHYHRAEGFDHSWEFWDTELIHFLNYLDLKKEEGRYLGI